MSMEIRMPSLDPAMTKARVVKWLKEEGDPVEVGDAVVEIETDKAVVEVEAEGAGRFGKPLVKEGDYAEVNSVIGVLLEEGEAMTSAAAPAAEPIAQPALAEQPSAEPAAAAGVASAASEPVAAAGDRRERIFASPLARRLAKQAGLALEAMTGSGPNGRIVKRDIELAVQSGTGRAAPQKPASALTQSLSLSEKTAFMPDYRILELNAVRRTLARRLTESSQQVPHYFLTVDCELDPLLRIRKELNASNADGSKLSINDFIIRAVAFAMKKVPAANVAWGDESILQFDQVDIAVAVAIDGGLITPVVRDAGNKAVFQISREVRELAAKARAGKLLPKEYQGGTFTISNLGMYGIKSFTSIINPPQGGILSVGAAEQRPVVKAGELAIATLMTVTLAADHRCIDGAVGAEFLSAFKGFVEAPITMLLAEG